MHITSQEYLRKKINAAIKINDDTLDKIVSRFQYQEVPKNKFILSEGGRCDFWGFIHTGLVRVYSHSDTGLEVTNGFASDGGFITDSTSFFSQSPSLENFYTLEETSMIFITAERLKELYDDFPVFEKFSRILYEQRLVEIKAKILFRVQLDAQSRYLCFLKNRPELIRRVPLKYIASYLNITDSTLSRVRKKTMHLQM